MPTTTEPTRNGVNVTQLLGTIQAVKDQPALGAAKFRARNRWLSGGHNRSTIHGFYAAGQEDTTRTAPFTLDADEPPALCGTDAAANPAEIVLHALAACLTTSLVYHAAARGIVIEELESQLEGDLDLQGFMGLAADVRKGFQNIRVNLRIKSPASTEQLRELAQFSPIFDTIRNPVAVTINVTK